MTASDALRRSRIPLADGQGAIPAVGFGTLIPDPVATKQATKVALEVGFRHLDCAERYRNEEEVGAAISEAIGAGTIRREELFVTTKLWNSDHGYEAALHAFEKSQRRLGLGYVDLYLIHWPVSQLRDESWRALVELQRRGSCRAIGVSNYTVRHLDELLGGSSVVPDVDQVEFNPFLYQEELLRYCEEKRIQLEAYSPLTRGHRLRDPVVLEVAKTYSKSPAQILIRWSLQHGLVVIPKSARPERIKENSEVFDFEISAPDMSRLDSLGENLHMDWDPTDAL